MALCALQGCSSESRSPAVDQAAAQACSQLPGLNLEGARLDSAVMVPASQTVAEYCKVQGTIRSGFKFQVHLPSNWNGKLIYQGGGGWDGVLGLAPDASNSNYVLVGSNAGHVGANTLDATFALNNPQARDDFGFLSPHDALKVAKALVRLRYGVDAQRHYFHGCSNGGREALMQASRYPQDYDGIVAIAPAYTFTELFQAFIRNAQALSMPGAAISVGKAKTIANAARVACDAQDGLADGIVSKPQACRFDPAVLKCTKGDSNACLTAPQLAAVQTIYSETYDASGYSIYPGWDAGGEDEGWKHWISNPPQSNLGLQFLFAEGFVKYWITGDAQFDALKFSPTHYPAQMKAAAATLDASPDLSAFLSKGRKLLLVHGTHDWAISYKGSIKYFEQVATASGGTSVRDASMEFFLLPGVQHCGGGVGPSEINLLDAVEQWVESGVRPSTRSLTVRKTDAETGKLQLSRPLCRYPSYPHYDGVGDPKASSSFRCVTP